VTNANTLAGRILSGSSVVVWTVRRERRLSREDLDDLDGSVRRRRREDEPASCGEDPVTTSKAVARKTSSTFRMDCAIDCTIRASADRIWALLTDAPRFPRWNSTVTAIEGAIVPGATLALTVPSAPGRVFKPKVVTFEPGRSMVWRDGMAPMFTGVRTFTLAPSTDGSTQFSMKEEFWGVMLPMIKGSLPDFAPVFEAYAEDLKREAEKPLEPPGPGAA
jgi:hypothetical protein